MRNERALFTETVGPRLGLPGLFGERFRIVSCPQRLEREIREQRKRKFAATLVTRLIMVICVLRR